ncbi:MAG: PDZ domain-containing protein [bacterium]|nr:PDZ domain-containing protein [bacterium]
MTIRHRLMVAAILGLALTCSLTGSAWAAPNDQETEEAKKKRIIRVISASDGSPVELENEDRVLIMDERRIAAPHVIAGLSHRRGYLGVRMVELTPELRRHFGTPEEAGVLISSVVDGSPAAQAGLKVGDILTAIGGESVASPREVAKRVFEHTGESITTLEIWRDGAVTTLSATIVERERPAIDIGRFALPDAERHHERIWVGSDNIPEQILEIDHGGLRDALREIELRFDDPDFVQKFKVLGQNRLDLQKRIEELEERLKDLEEQLDKLPND